MKIHNVHKTSTHIINKINFIISDQIADRGERLELLVDKTEDLSSNVSSAFGYSMIMQMVGLKLIIAKFQKN